MHLFSISATALPIPCAPPVTTAAFPLNACIDPCCGNENRRPELPQKDKLFRRVAQYKFLQDFSNDCRSVLGTGGDKSKLCHETLLGRYKYSLFRQHAGRDPRLVQEMSCGRVLL
eukprot:3934133-Rhodomonas_salina.2